MSKILLYGDLRKAAQDIVTHPNAAVIADFIIHWSKEFSDALGEGFAYVLLDELNNYDSSELTREEIGLVDNWDINKYSHSQYPQIKFARAFLSKAIEEEDEMFFGKRDISFDGRKNKTRPLSFRIPKRYKDKLTTLISNLNVLEHKEFRLLDPDTDVSTFIDVLLAEDLKDSKYKSVKIKFDCTTGIVSYVLYEISKNFAAKRGPNLAIFNDLDIFFTQDNMPLKGGNLSQRSSKFPKNFEDIRTSIDHLFTDHNPRKGLNKRLS